MNATPHRLLSVVVVDDVADNADSLADYIISHGHRVRVAYLGATALEMFRQEPADLAFIDVALPDMAGHMLSASIRSLLQDAIYIVAMTGFSDERERVAALHAGCDSFLVKPFQGEQINEMLDRAIMNHRKT